MPISVTDLSVILNSSPLPPFASPRLSESHIPIRQPWEALEYRRGLMVTAVLAITMFWNANPSFGISSNVLLCQFAVWSIISPSVFNVSHFSKYFWSWVVEPDSDSLITEFSLSFVVRAYISCSWFEFLFDSLPPF